MDKLNCWEFKNCGRGPGGVNVHKMGICPASIEVSVNGLNFGKNGGRVCWAVAGTLCGGVIQGSFAAKVGTCMSCEFHKLVLQEEGANSARIGDILAKQKK